MTSEGTAPGGLDLSVTALFRASASPAPPLRVGVVLPERGVARWADHLVAALLDADFVTLLRVHAAARPADSAPGAAFRLYDRACATRYAHVDPLAPVARRAALDALPTLDCDVLPTAGALDVVLDLRGRAPPPACVRAARHGAWTVDCEREDALPQGFGALEGRTPLTTLELRSHALDADARQVVRVLARAVVATTPAPNAVANRVAPYWAGHHLALQALRTLHADGAATLATHAPPAESGPTTEHARPPHSATAARLVHWCAREGVRRAVRRLRRAPTLTDWSVALRRADVPLPERDPRDAFVDATYLRNPRGRFLADPHLHAHAGRTWLFAEDYAFDRARGAISCGEVRPNGTVEDFRTCLDPGHHVSYPHVFHHDGETWLVPESEASGTVDLYRALEFPYRWTRERTLLRFRCVDPTLVRHGGAWWLYATHVPLAGVDATLLLWHADSPLGPWRLHERRAIAVDVRRGRAAGPAFVHAGRLLRPAQWSVPHYGRALALYSVERLCVRDYEERLVARFDAPAGLGLDGLHHYSRCGEWEAFDVRMQSALARFDERPARDAAGRLASCTLEGEVIPRR